MQDEAKTKEQLTIELHALHEVVAEDVNGQLKWFLVESIPQQLSNGDILWNGVPIDIAERKRAEQELERFLDLAPNMVCIASTDGYFRKTNKEWERGWGYSQDELLSAPFGDFIYPDDRETTFKEVERQIAENTTIHFINRYRAKDGSYRWIDWNAFPEESCKVLYAKALGITERKRVEEELNNCRDHLDDLIKARTAELAGANKRLTLEIEERRRAEDALKLFAYSVAHDLKSPAIGIYGLTKRLHQLCRDHLDEKSRSYCDQILKVSKHIAALVEKINVYIATKEARLSFEKTSLKEIFGMLKNEFVVQLNTRQVDLIVPDSEVEITADRLSLLRAFSNLVDNALKYGGERLSRIRIGHGERGDCHVFSFIDNGKGIEGADAEKIFGLFQRYGTARGIEGAGMGLAIVKEIAQRHGGQVWLEQGAKEGTTFCISISKNL
jgi:PAS domain S-box-containing protein